MVSNISLASIFFWGSPIPLLITFALGNLRALGNLNQRCVRLFSRQVHLGHEKEVLYRPVERQSRSIIVADKEKNQRHEEKHALLSRVTGLRCDGHLP